MSCLRLHAHRYYQFVYDGIDSLYFLDFCDQGHEGTSQYITIEGRIFLKDGFMNEGFCLVCCTTEGHVLKDGFTTDSFLSNLVTLGYVFHPWGGRCCLRAHRTLRA